MAVTPRTQIPPLSTAVFALLLVQKTFAVSGELPTACSHVWEVGGEGCPAEAVCVPNDVPGTPNSFPEGGNHCACEFSELLLQDEFTFDSIKNSTVLHRCKPTPQTNALIAAYVLIVLATSLVALHLLYSLVDAKKAKLFRADVLGVSSSLNLCGDLCLALSRITCVVILTTRLNPYPTAASAVTWLNFVLLGLLAFFVVFGGLFLAVATLKTLDRASRMVGIRHQRLRHKTATQFGIIAGLCTMIPVVALLFVELPQLVSTVLAICAILMYTTYYLLTRSLTRTIRRSISGRSSDLKHTLQIVHDMSFRLRASLLCFLFASSAYVLCWYVGRSTKSKFLISVGIGLANLAQYITFTGFLGSLALSTRQMWNHRILRSGVEPRRLDRTVQSFFRRTTVFLRMPSNGSSFPTYARQRTDNTDVSSIRAEPTVLYGNGRAGSFRAQELTSNTATTLTDSPARASISTTSPAKMSSTTGSPMRPRVTDSDTDYTTPTNTNSKKQGQHRLSQDTLGSADDVPIESVSRGESSGVTASQHATNTIKPPNFEEQP